MGADRDDEAWRRRGWTLWLAWAWVWVGLLAPLVVRACACVEPRRGRSLEGWASFVTERNLDASANFPHWWCTPELGEGKHMHAHDLLSPTATKHRLFWYYNALTIMYK